MSLSGGSCGANLERNQIKDLELIKQSVLMICPPAILAFSRLRGIFLICGGIWGFSSKKLSFHALKSFVSRAIINFNAVVFHSLCLEKLL